MTCFSGGDWNETQTSLTFANCIFKQDLKKVCVNSGFGKLVERQHKCLLTASVFYPLIIRVQFIAGKTIFVENIRDQFDFGHKNDNAISSLSLKAMPKFGLKKHLKTKTLNAYLQSAPGCNQETVTRENCHFECV